MEMPNRYDFKESEARWQKRWAESGLFRFRPGDPGELFSIDTPPPTVSGKLHIGHVFSYTQTEIIARYQRMRGRNVYYPFGFDDNGLPTEMLTEREHGVRGEALSREAFTKLCLATSAKYATLFRDLWVSLGFTADWDNVYTTFSDASRRISQRSFLDLLAKGRVYRREMPTLWCTGCKTAFAQAEIEDQPKAGRFHYLNFTTVEGEPIPIATTRPELLPACVAVFVHPENARFKALIGRRAIVPLFGQEVPVLADAKADPEKGTGVVMCCTFGDSTDIEWWKLHRLPLRIAFTDAGHMTDLAGPYAGLFKTKARAAIAEALKATGALFDEKEIPAESRFVNTHERCGTEVEYLVKKQWFISIVDAKRELIEQGAKVRWHPAHMGTRYRNWVENLNWDWAVSRQRYFGVPIPVWYCDACGKVAVPAPAQLPVDPIVDRPAAPCECGGEAFTPERDVLDTWATSSVTPEINGRWGEADERAAFRPMSMRPQAHDIIRTWAFYTIVKSFYHFGGIPWRDAVISGHCVKRGAVPAGDGPQVAGKEYARKSKISKSKDGDAFSPQQLIEKHSADAIRWWTAGGKLGTDVVFDEAEVVDTNRLLTKLWNASRFALQFLEGYRPGPRPALEPTDRWFLAKLDRLVRLYHESFAEFEFYPQRMELQNFFWHVLCDNYIEFAKDRLYNVERRGAAGAEAARWTLHHGLLAVLKLFAPYIPHITEEIYDRHFRALEGAPSIHTSRLPDPDPAAADPGAEAAGDLLVGLVGLVRGFKSRMGWSVMLPVKRLVVVAPEATCALGHGIVDDLAAIACTSAIDFVTQAPEGLEFMPETLAEGAVRVAVVPDVEAVRAARLTGIIKAGVKKLRKANGVPEGETLKRLLVAGPADLLPVLVRERERLLFTTKSAEVVFGPVEGGEPLDEGLSIAFEA